MSHVSLNATVGELVVEQPSRSRVFSKLGIDFCCGGAKTLAQACREKALEPETVLGLLVNAPPAPRSEWADAPLVRLTDHIVRVHHEPTRAELARLTQMIDKVARVHGKNHPFMVEVASVFHGFADELLAHMLKEERVLFPAIAALESGAEGVNVTMPIRVMNGEHDSAGDALKKMRALTSGFVTPEGGCNTFRASLAGLEELEADLHEHVHLESNVLFPRALQLVA